MKKWVALGRATHREYARLFVYDRKNNGKADGYAS